MAAALRCSTNSAARKPPGRRPEGLFFEDTRYLSQLHPTIDDQRPLLLSSRMTEDNAMLAVDLANPDLSAGGKLRLPGAMVHIQLGIALGDGALFLTLDLSNYGKVPASFRLDFHLDADFADIFEVRGAVAPPPRRVPAGGVAPGRAALRLSRPGRGHPSHAPGLRPAARSG